LKSGRPMRQANPRDGRNPGARVDARKEPQINARHGALKSFAILLLAKISRNSIENLFLTTPHPGVPLPKLRQNKPVHFCAAEVSHRLRRILGPRSFAAKIKTAERDTFASAARQSCGARGYFFSSSDSSCRTAAAATLSSLSKRSSRTPCVERPASRISLACTRITLP
jgi:hypothetical protein